MTETMFQPAISSSRAPGAAASPRGECADLVQILASLVAFDTTSCHSNLPVIDWIERYLSALGFRTERIEDPKAGKANLLASVGPQGGDGYVLSGHTDTVPVVGQSWTSNPFELRLENGRAYGRGACDMKGFLAACLAVAPEMARAPLRRPMHLAFSYDEEVGCVGARQLCTSLRERGFQAAGCFVGEPTGMDTVIGHKSKRNLRVNVNGHACHSSLAPRGVNAVQWGARLVAEIDRLAGELADRGARDSDYDVPHTTTHVGVFRGGSALNVVSAEAEILFEVRALATDDPDHLIAGVEAFARRELVPAMQRNHPGAGITFDVTASTPGLETSVDAPIVALARALTGSAKHRKVAFMTEAGLFQQIAGLSTIVIGPGSIDQAHTADEWIEIEQLSRCEDFLKQLIIHCTN